MASIPLILDLDGTFIRTDTTYELCVEHIKRRWVWGAIELLFWFLANRAKAKDRLAHLHGERINLRTLPFSNLIETDVYQTANTRILVSGSAGKLVEGLAACHDDITQGYGSNPSVNLIGNAKANFLRDKFPGGFDYVGDSLADLKVWPHARRAYAFNAKPATLAKAKKADIELINLGGQEPAWTSAVKACRPHQWAKNGLIAILPLLNFSQFEVIWVIWLILAFLAFSLVASATYIFNDLLDIQADRAHSTKKGRPFASGRLPIIVGIRIMLLLGLLGFGLAYFLNLAFMAMLAGYVIFSVMYSTWLKKIPILDILALSFLFCWRLLAGGALFDVTANAWFILAIGFFFGSLALGKRAIELRKINAQGQASSETITGRGYIKDDLPLINAAGIASSFTSVIVIAIYAFLEEAATIQREPVSIIIVLILAYWQLRFWLMVGRNRVHDDPVIFALKDRTSVLTLGLLGILVIIEQCVPAGTEIFGIIL